jgi:hypothetical protein
MNSIIGDLTTETISLVYKECEKDKNKRRLSKIITRVINIALEHINPYLYTIMTILILLFVINCVQFYYYMKILIINKEGPYINIDDILTKN